MGPGVLAPSSRFKQLRRGEGKNGPLKRKGVFRQRPHPVASVIILGYAGKQSGAATTVMWMGKTERMAKLMDKCDKAKAPYLQTIGVHPSSSAPFSRSPWPTDLGDASTCRAAGLLYRIVVHMNHDMKRQCLPKLRGHRSLAAKRPLATCQHGVIRDTIDGRPIQRSDISIAHKKLEEMSDEELAARIAALEEEERAALRLSATARASGVANQQQNQELGT